MACTCLSALFTRYHKTPGVAKPKTRSVSADAANIPDDTEQLFNQNQNHQQLQRQSSAASNSDSIISRRSAGSRRQSKLSRRRSTKAALGEQLGIVNEEHQFHWGYDSLIENGPEKWAEYFPDGLGKYQSPIDIDTQADCVRYGASLTPLKFDYERSKALSLFNTGHCFQVAFDLKAPATLTGGPLTDKFQLLQFHGHWGTSDEVGSEHTLNGRAFSSELHFVHFNKDKYETPEEARHHLDGYAVVAVFLTIATDPDVQNDELQNLIGDGFNAIINDDREIPLDFLLQPLQLMPADVTRYYTYYGSLTTPPLSECVTWIVLETPVEISDEQMAHFRELHVPGEDRFIENNFRPVQPVNDRIVQASFPNFRKVTAAMAPKIEVQQAT